MIIQFPPKKSGGQSRYDRYGSYACYGSYATVFSEFTNSQSFTFTNIVHELDELINKCHSNVRKHVGTLVPCLAFFPVFHVSPGRQPLDVKDSPHHHQSSPKEDSSHS